ncbi:MAG: Hsp20/alpha crystallin family protein, partial [Phycisphaerae bacterium]
MNTSSTCCNPTQMRSATPVRSATQRVVEGPTFTPAIDVIETSDAFLLIADVPGATRETVSVEYDNGMLTIQCPIAPRVTDESRFARREYAIGDYRRSVRIGEAIDVSRIGAELANGQLTLTLPKTEAVRIRKV